MFIAVMAVTIPLLEKMGEQKIQAPEAYIWTRTFTISIKGIFMVAVFVINDTPGDFFIALFFWFTSTIGMFYFYCNPYVDQKYISSMNFNSIKEAGLRQVQ